MLKKTFGYILLLLILSSCSRVEKKITPKIEIYLTENRIESYQGIKITENNIDTLGLRRLENRFDFNTVRFDTIASELIFAGAFKAKKTDLKKEPFLAEKEIHSFDYSNGTITLSEIGGIKLSKMDFDSNGKQFVLLINDKLELFGYFYPTLYSNWCSTYQYPYIPNQKWTELELTFGKNFRAVNLKAEFKDLYNTFNSANDNAESTIYNKSIK